jgi:hypothetical protein
MGELASVPSGDTVAGAFYNYDTSNERLLLNGTPKSSFFWIVLLAQKLYSFTIWPL